MNAPAADEKRGPKPFKPEDAILWLESSAKHYEEKMHFLEADAYRSIIATIQSLRSETAASETDDEWYEREKTAFRAWWEAEGEKTFSETPTMAAGAGWLKRAEEARVAPSAIATLPEDVRDFIRHATLQIQAHRSKTPEEMDRLFQLAYGLYAKYRVEGEKVTY